MFLDVIGFFWSINVRKRWYSGLFCSVGRSVDEKWVGIKLAKVVNPNN